MRSPVLSVESVSKTYGSTQALKGVSFSLSPGEVVGLIGPNGAGKTTTIRLISTLIKPSSGRITVCGMDAVRNPRELRKVIGVYPETAGLYETLTPYENLSFYASFYDVNDKDERITRYLELFGLADRRDTHVGKLSKGMKEKVAFIRSVIHDPALILLDEPLAGLDPDSRIVLKDLLKQSCKSGKAILMSSHTLSEVETICDRVILVDSGEVLVDDRISDLRERFKTDRLPSLEEVYLAVRGWARSSGPMERRGT